MSGSRGLGQGDGRQGKQGKYERASAFEEA